MENVRTGTICAIISMTSVLIMLVWGMITNDWSQCWLVVTAGGILSCTVHMVRKDLDSADGGNDSFNC